VPPISTAKSTSAHAVLASLRESISTGRWAPGTPLRQAELADEFGVSRIPVREALQTLQSEGLVLIEPNRGAYVAGLTAAQLNEIFELRALLESDVLRRAVPGHSERSLRQLEAIQRELDHETVAAEWVRLDRAFHDALYAPSARERSLQLIAGLRASVERFYLSHLGPDARRGGWNDEHQQLMDAVRQRDAARAVELLVRHLRHTQDLALAALQAAPGPP
jgi:DNA-binding GntR family transcriptional regulator